jgi:hypothetical protein
MEFLYKRGNLKLPKSTLIINMGSAVECPSAKRGLCEIAGKCYAARDEKRHSNVVPGYRDRQAGYWLSHSAMEIVEDLVEVCSRQREEVTHVRWNESGDFYGRGCVSKLKDIARSTPGLVHYLYTHRTDLLEHMKDRPRNLVIQVSTTDRYKASLYSAAGFNVFYTDTEIDLRKDRKVTSEVAQVMLKEKHSTKWVCKWDCSKCSLCKVNGAKVIVNCLH